MKKAFRIGQIVPSSNTTMETEIPAMLRAREGVLPERFTFHSSRMRMKKVTKEELEAMDKDSDRCALELSDARVDVLGYACLVDGLKALGARRIAIVCPYMKSLTRLVVDYIEAEVKIPVVSAAVCTTWQMLKALDLEARVPDAGALLSGRY